MEVFMNRDKPLSGDPMNNPGIPSIRFNGISTEAPRPVKNMKTCYSVTTSGQKKAEVLNSRRGQAKEAQRGGVKRSCRFVDTVTVLGNMESRSVTPLGSSTSTDDVNCGRKDAGSVVRNTSKLLRQRVRAHSAVLDTKRVRDDRSRSLTRPCTALGRAYNTNNHGITLSCTSLFSNSNSRLEDALTKIRRESKTRRHERTVVSAPVRGQNSSVSSGDVKCDGTGRDRRVPSAPSGATTSSVFARRPKSMWKFMKDHRKDAVLSVRSRRKRARQLFKWAVQMVKMALHYQRAMVEISRNASTLSAVESQWYTLHVSKESQTLVFNPANFAQNKGLTRVPRWAKSILDTVPSERSPEDCRKIHALLRGLKNFDKFTEKIQLAMCQAFIYYRVQPMRVILRKGHIGHNFYFIYSGSVFVNIEDTDNTGEMFSKTEAVLSKGDSFGEIALLKDVPRTATITCREECELLVVDKEIFSQVCPRIFDIELEEKSQFIRKLALFHPKYWQSDVIRKLSFDALIQEYKTAKVVCQSSAHDEWLYVCMEGSCRLVKCLAFDDKESHKRENLGEDELSIEFIENMKNKGELSETGDPNNNIHHVRTHAQNRNSDGGHVRFSTISEDEESLSTRKPSFSRRHRPIGLRRSMSAQSDDSKNRTTDLNSLQDYCQFKGSVRGSANLQSKRDQMLSALDLEYVCSPMMVEENTKKYKASQSNGNLTLTSLIRRKMETSGGMHEFVYLDIGRLNSGEIFDLGELLVPSDPSVRSSLILVSAGAKLLKLKKSLILSTMTPEGLDHAKHLARNSLYPTNEVLVNSIKEKQQWQKYKGDVFDETISPYRHLKRHSHAVHLLGNSTKHRDQRLIYGLRTDVDQNKDMQLEDLNEFDNPLGDDPDVEEEFESRMLMNAVAIHEKLKIKPMMPPGVERRNSFTGSKQYICTSAAVYSKQTQAQAQV